ncbi:hypothetical protein Vafri_18815, partial [Volvox africanus]
SLSPSSSPSSSSEASVSSSSSTSSCSSSGRPFFAASVLLLLQLPFPLPPSFSSLCGSSLTVTFPAVAPLPGPFACMPAFALLLPGPFCCFFCCASSASSLSEMTITSSLLSGTVRLLP